MTFGFVDQRSIQLSYGRLSCKSRISRQNRATPSRSFCLDVAARRKKPDSRAYKAVRAFCSGASEDIWL